MRNRAKSSVRAAKGRLDRAGTAFAWQVRKTVKGVEYGTGATRLRGRNG